MTRPLEGRGARAHSWASVAVARRWRTLTQERRVDGNSSTMMPLPHPHRRRTGRPRSVRVPPGRRRGPPGALERARHDASTPRAAHRGGAPDEGGHQWSSKAITPPSSRWAGTGPRPLATNYDAPASTGRASRPLHRRCAATRRRACRCRCSQKAAPSPGATSRRTWHHRARSPLLGRMLGLTGGRHGGRAMVSHTAEPRPDYSSSSHSRPYT